MGLFIVLEAIDRGGKSTQLKLLAEAIQRAGYRVATIAYPDRSAQATGKPIDDFLRGRINFVSDPNASPTISMLLGQILFSINRRERADLLERLLSDHDVVLCSRYRLSGRVYAVAGGVPETVIDALQAGLESDLRNPDLTLVLDVDPSVITARARDGGLDRFEADLDFQKAVRAGYVAAALSDPRVRLVPAFGKPEDVTARLLDELASLPALDRLRRCALKRHCCLSNTKREDSIAGKNLDDKRSAH